MKIWTLRLSISTSKGNPDIQIIDKRGIQGASSGDVYFYIDHRAANWGNELMLGIDTDERQRMRRKELMVKEPDYSPEFEDGSWYKFIPDGSIKKTVWLSSICSFEDIARDPGLKPDEREIESRIESMQEYTIIGLSLQRLREELKRIT